MLRKITLIMIILSGILFSVSAQDSDRGVLIDSAPRTEAGGQRWALIVGINDYTNVPTLRYGRSDAETLAKTLVERCGFPRNNVILMTDGQEILSDPVSRSRYPTIGNLRSRINQISQLVESDDLLMISFAGHGINIDGKGYIIPVDGDSKDIYSLIPLSLIKETLESSPARQKLLILDACYSGVSRAGDETQSPAEAILSPLNGAGFITLASCDSQQLSHEDEQVGRGVFTNAIIEGLEGRADIEVDGNRDGIITATELFGFASLKVKQWSLASGKDQTPVFKGERKGRIELARIGILEEVPEKSPLLIDSGKTDSSITLAVVVPIKTKAELMWEDVKNFDRTKGLDKLLDEAEIALKNAQTFFQEKAYSEAKSYYEDTIAKCENIITLEQKQKNNVKQVITNSIGMKLVYIPAGDFMMGDPTWEKDAIRPNQTQGPQHKVTISKGFWMGIYEVTQAQYKTVMKNNPSNFKGDDLPVEQVSWERATEFCKKLSQKEGKTYRLPTEAEWEYACRAGTQTQYYFGEDDSLLEDYAWYGDNNNKTHPVGQKKPNAFGLYDMHGNVWEWCLDTGSNNYEGAPNDGSAWTTGGNTSRIFRGGAWGVYSLTSTIRNWRSPDFRSDGVGFRVVLEVE
ncbi:MAG: SUMF1/EgtB/PvdO family nonheme iron enzyme [Sedimentisphaerales bacterium]|nr:SUMF1/EgtB/PvdO family nonheme iron enzyme [Sedimentisphaerales bacterium]